MSMFVAGLVIFFASHLLRVAAPDFRENMIRRLGKWGWKGVYSVISIIGLGLLIVGYADAKPASDWLYSPPVWTRHLAALVVLPALVLLVAAYLPGRIRRATGHPMTLAVVLWSGAHLLANGQVVDVMLFGAFFAWSLVVLFSARRRASGAGSDLALPAGPANDILAVVIGIGLWAWLAFGGHRVLFGMPIFG